MEVQEIKLGDFVIHKSGGPIMTVDSIDSSGYRCIWFNFFQAKEKYFSKDSLKRLDKSSVSRRRIIRVTIAVVVIFMVLQLILGG